MRWPSRVSEWVFRYGPLYLVVAVSLIGFGVALLAKQTADRDREFFREALIASCESANAVREDVREVKDALTIVVQAALANTPGLAPESLTGQPQSEVGVRVYTQQLEILVRPLEDVDCEAVHAESE